MPNRDSQFSNTPHQRAPITDDSHHLEAVHAGNLQGAQARSALIALDLQDMHECVAKNGRVSISKLEGATVLEAQANGMMKCAIIYDDRSVIEIHRDEQDETFVQTQVVYSPNGTVETLQVESDIVYVYGRSPRPAPKVTPQYERVSIEHGREELCQEVYEKYDALHLEIEEGLAEKKAIEKGLA